ncbi:MAG: tetratricopeptide repeat protein [Desulfatibacillaceae bacterium]
MANHVEMYEKGHQAALEGRFRDAIEAFDQAIRMNKSFAEAYFGRAVCRIKVGDTIRGDADIAMAAKLGNREARMLLEQKRAETKLKNNRCIRCNATLLDEDRCWNCGMTYAPTVAPAHGSVSPADSGGTGAAGDEQGPDNEGDLSLDDVKSAMNPLRITRFTLTASHLVIHAEGTFVRDDTEHVVKRAFHVKLDWIKEITISAGKQLFKGFFSKKPAREVRIVLHGSFPVMHRGSYLDVREISGRTNRPLSVRRWEYLSRLVGTSAPLCPMCRDKSMVFIKPRCTRRGETALNTLLLCRSCRKRFIYDFDLGEYEHVGANF